MHKQYEIFANYRQFYLWDHERNSGAPTDYDDEDIRRRIKAVPFVVVVQPERDMIVPVAIEVLAEPPSDGTIEEWDHVAEASLDLPSGKLEIHECTGGSIDILCVPSGSYRVRVYFGGLSTLSSDGLDGDDRYRVVLWPGPVAPIRVLKHYVEPD